MRQGHCRGQPSSCSTTWPESGRVLNHSQELCTPVSSACWTADLSLPSRWPSEGARQRGRLSPARSDESEPSTSVSKKGSRGGRWDGLCVRCDDDLGQFLLVLLEIACDFVTSLQLLLFFSTLVVTRHEKS